MSSVQARFYWMWRERKRSKPVGFSSAILPIIIVLLVVFIYLLSHFSIKESGLRHMLSGVSYPQSEWAEEILPGVDVVVGDRRIVVDGVPASDVSDAWDDETFFADAIQEKLNDVKRNSQLFPPDKYRFRRITLSADRNTPFRIIRNIMRVARTTGYTEIQFVVFPKKPERISPGR